MGNCYFGYCKWPHFGYFSNRLFSTKFQTKFFSRHFAYKFLWPSLLSNVAQNIVAEQHLGCKFWRLNLLIAQPPLIKDSGDPALVPAFTVFNVTNWDMAIEFGIRNILHRDHKIRIQCTTATQFPLFILMSRINFKPPSRNNILPKHICGWLTL